MSEIRKTIIATYAEWIAMSALRSGAPIKSRRDVYTALRRNGRPAEYVYYPDGQHVLTRPREQLTSQQGNVDWYRFWLAGEEDRDPAKAEQYRRWRAMREEAARPPVAAQ